ncbi:carboxypeptidase-like regulatory domain-containing protein [Seonamhaeicola sp. ML3]|uniref:carboxypeptidase-like regulatory domain-containing protein n=1 Tax=Seonamhaeicola sp. ML3 TaxID=2937786 RepID=UPI00200F771A|nr:carboxypeptidase-like regulatory domain-containing protein [Seonamhaeicola sp. ML3]
MLKTNLVFAFFFIFGISFAQEVEISGKVISKTDVENIHVINKTAQVFTITNINGEFKINAEVHDTLQFSSIQFGVKDIIVTKGTILSKTMIVPLDEQTNELEEVLVGKVLTGNLLSDIENADTNTPINFYDVGIPGYKGKIATQSERRLAQAGEFKPKMLIGMILGGASLDPIINGLTGRTKMLKERVEIENRQNLIRKIRSKHSKALFTSYELKEQHRNEFFFFCEEASDFMVRCKGKSDFQVFQYLTERLKAFKKILKTKVD